METTGKVSEESSSLSVPWSLGPIKVWSDKRRTLREFR